jgi:hypothetical protein
MPCCCIAATICSDSEALTRTSFAPWPISRGLTIWSARLERRTLLEKPQPRLGRPARGPVSGSSVLVRRFFRLAYPGWQSFPCAPRGRQRRPPISTDSLLERDGFGLPVPSASHETVNRRLWCRLDHGDLGVVRHQQVRHPANRLEGAGMGTDPVAKRLGPARLGIGEVRSAAVAHRRLGTVCRPFGVLVHHSLCPAHLGFGEEGCRGHADLFAACPRLCSRLDAPPQSA